MSKIYSINLIIFLSVLFILNFQSSSFAVLGDAVSELKTCAEDDETANCQGTCLVNADGAIVISSVGLPSDADNVNSLRDSCQMIPDEYRVTLYKGALCTEDPYTTTGATVDYASKCDFFFNNSAGKAITLVSGADGTATANESLVENGLNLGIKTYTHAIMVMSNHLEIKHEQDYDFSGTETASSMIGGGDTFSSGTTCWTVAKTSTFANLDGTTGADHGSLNAAHAGLTLSTGDGTSVESSTQCGTSAAAAPVFATEIIESFGEATGNWGASAVTSRWAYQTTPVDIGGTKAAILLESDFNTVATTMDKGVAMLYTVNLTNPLVITESTSIFEIGFGLSQSVSIDFSTTQTGGNRLINVKHGADPVDIKFTVN
jgi:hypothetical protein